MVWRDVFALRGVFITTTLVYSNHFENPFFFDDSHTIESNQAITSLNEWTSFFNDAKKHLSGTVFFKRGLKTLVGNSSFFDDA